ncbi:hypothetical protein AB9E13_35605, partial [Rhizobium leguminosarum]
GNDRFRPSFAVSRSIKNVGGGIVINGRPLGGLAGHFGLTKNFGGCSTYLEDQVSGRWMQEEAARQGFGATPAPDIFN